MALWICRAIRKVLDPFMTLRNDPIGPSRQPFLGWINSSSPLNLVYRHVSGCIIHHVFLTIDKLRSSEFPTFSKFLEHLILQYILQGLLPSSIYMPKQFQTIFLILYYWSNRISFLLWAHAWFYLQTFLIRERQKCITFALEEYIKQTIIELTKIDLTMFMLFSSSYFNK